ncbi:MAG: hypothetical protein LJF06_03500 [Gemmatimonadetes bacterium]|nr:hypothetical protein [Gemmatimonadota bacterium]
MRPHILMIVLGLLATGTAGPAAAQETSRTRARETLPATVFAQVEAMARVAEQDGIPGDILFNKALEGAAKHVPADRLVPAVQAYAGRLQEARSAFGSGAGGPLLVAGADALQRGVRASLLKGLGSGGERSPAAVLVLADLVQAGVADDQALSLVREAMRRRTREQQMLDMPAEVRRLMRQGQSMQQAVEQVRQRLQSGRGGGVMAPVAPGSEPMTRARSGNGGG